jgi:hypothetical protein
MVIVGGLGAVGGIANCAVAQEFRLPGKDEKANVWRPGWIGNVAVGAVAAVIIWGVYGPLSSFDLVNDELKNFHLTVGQLLGSPLVGFGGGRFLTMASEKEAERVAKTNLAKLLESFSQHGGI